MISIKHKNSAQPLEKLMTSSMILNEAEAEAGAGAGAGARKISLTEDEKEDLRECRLLELDLLDGAIAPTSSFEELQVPLKLQPHHLHLPPPVNHGYIAACAVHELSTLALDNNGFLWTKSPVDGTDILDRHHYQQTFPRPASSSNSWTHASRASAVVNMEHTQLLKLLTTDHKWIKLFPSIVSQATCLRSLPSPHGSSLQLFYTVLQATTPLLPKRKFAFLRTCKQIDHSTWVVADISIDRSRNVGFPQGCLIQGLDGGLSQVIWVEHFEFEQNYINHKLYTHLTSRGFGFGAQRWVDCLERSCERRSFKTMTSIFVPRLVEPDYQLRNENKFVMKLSHRMVSTFCSNIACHGLKQQLMSSIPAPQNPQIFTSYFRSQDDPKQMFVVSSITFKLSYSPESVFEILGDENRRHEWDLSGEISRFFKPTCFTTGNDSRNKISLYQTHSFTAKKVVLQEATVNRSGSLIVWSSLKSDDFDRVKIGKYYAWCPPLIGLSGLAISSNSHQNTTSSSNTGGGSIVTLGVQQEVRDTKEPDSQTTELARKYMLDLLRKIVMVLNKPQGPPPVWANKRFRGST